MGWFADLFVWNFGHVTHIADKRHYFNRLDLAIVLRELLVGIGAHPAPLPTTEAL